MHRRHSLAFKLQVCGEVSSGVLSWREAQRLYGLSPSSIRVWLAHYHGNEREMKKTDPSLLAEYEAKVAALERKVGQLTMEIELLKKTQRQRRANTSVPSSVVSGPRLVPSEGDAK